MNTTTDDDDSMGDFWRDVKAARQEKRADNRKSSAEQPYPWCRYVLTDAGRARLLSNECDRTSIPAAVSP